MLKITKLKMIHTMKAQTTKVDLPIMVLKSRRTKKEEETFLMGTQKDIKVVVPPLHQIIKRRHPTMRKQQINRNTAMSTMKRITTMDKKTMATKIHHQRHIKSSSSRKISSSTTQIHIRSQQEANSNIPTRQEVQIKETKMDTKIIITRKKKQHTKNLITREASLAMVRIHPLKRLKIIMKVAIINLVVPILIKDSKERSQLTTMAKKVIMIHAQKEGHPRVPMTTEDHQPKDLAPTERTPQNEVVILINNMEIIIINTEKNRNIMNIMMTTITNMKLLKRTNKIKKQRTSIKKHKIDMKLKKPWDISIGPKNKPIQKNLSKKSRESK